MEYSHLLSIVNPTTITILAAFLSLIYYLTLKRPRSASRRAPPEAGGAWPIIGHLPLLGGSQPAHITLGHMADKYGPIFTIRIGVHKTLIVSSWESAKECFTTNDKVFANRPKAVALEHMAYNYAMFGFSNYGPYWRQLRKITTQEMLSNDRLQMLSHIIDSEVKSAIKDIYELCRVNNNRAVVDMKKWFEDLTLNVAFRMIVGKRYHAATISSGEINNEESDRDEQCRRAIKEFFRLTGTFVVSDAIPYLRWFDFGGYEKAMKKTAKDFDKLLQGLLEDHKRKVEEQDFMGMMLSVLDGQIIIYSKKMLDDTIYLDTIYFTTV